MTRARPTWNRLHTRLTVTLAVVALGTYLTTFDSHLLTVAITIPLLILTVLGGVLFETTVALIIALTATGIIISTQQANGAWTGEEFALNALRLALLVLAALTGRQLGKTSRGAREAAVQASVTNEPAFGSLGLLLPDLGEERLTEELERARKFQRPLSIVRVETCVDARYQENQQLRDGASRGVARTLESVLYATDVLYAYNDNVVIGILPETNEDQLRTLTRRLSEILGRSSFLTRPDNERHCVSDYADVIIGSASYPRDGEDCDELLEASEAQQNPLPRGPLPTVTRNAGGQQGGRA